MQIVAIGAKRSRLCAAQDVRLPETCERQQYPDPQKAGCDADSQANASKGLRLVAADGDNVGRQRHRRDQQADHPKHPYKGCGGRASPRMQRNIAATPSQGTSDKKSPVPPTCRRCFGSQSWSSSNDGFSSAAEGSSTPDIAIPFGNRNAARSLPLPLAVRRSSLPSIAARRGRGNVAL